MRILALDVENLPLIGHTWKLYDTDIPHTNIIESQSLISISWRFVGEKKMRSVSIADDPKRFEKNIYDDYHVIKEFHKVLSTPDSFVMLYHNGDKFDLRKIQTAIIKHGLEPIPDRQSIDTLKQAKKVFKFDSNRLDYLGRYLGVGEKMETGGNKLWSDILQAKYPEVGKVSDYDLAYRSVKKMVEYNKNDVRLLERVFEKMKRYIKIPNWTLYNGKVVGCLHCGSQVFHSYGWRYNAVTKKRRFKCSGNGCGKPFDPPASMISYYEAALGF